MKITQDTWTSTDETLTVEYEVNEYTIGGAYGNRHADVAGREIVIDTISVLGVHLPQRIWNDIPTLINQIEENIRKELD